MDTVSTQSWRDNRKASWFGLIPAFVIVMAVGGGVSSVEAEEKNPPFGFTGEQARQAAQHPHAARKGIRAKQEHPGLTPERAKQLNRHRKAARGLNRMHEANPDAARKEAKKLNRAKQVYPGLNAHEVRKAKNNPVKARKAHKAHQRHGVTKQQMRKAKKRRR